VIICGAKISHDGAVAVIADGRLEFSVEIEKLANGRRYSALEDLELIEEILRAEGMALSDVDHFVVDGWHPPHGACTVPAVSSRLRGDAIDLKVSPYTESTLDGIDCPTRREFAFDGFGGAGYLSYSHAAGHLFGAYCTSPFASRGEDAVVLTWDGGMAPRLYLVRPGQKAVTALGPIAKIHGNLFGDFCSHFEPFSQNTAAPTLEERISRHLEIPGKAMAYAALGTVEQSSFPVFRRLMAEADMSSDDAAFAFGSYVARERDHLFPGMSNADLIASFQEFLGIFLVDRLAAAIRRTGIGPEPNLCFAGGCALNIKWNSMLSASGLFRDVWVPPFPNDSGSAIGAACCDLVHESGSWRLDWNVYSGPMPVPVDGLPPKWTARSCSETELAGILHKEAQPVVVIDGRAELGPRALGNRSILAPATSDRFRMELNRIKDRADYRPVAPICLEGSASSIFDSKGPQRYMLFDHRIRSVWEQRIPAVRHIDGSARLQTIRPTEHGTVAGRILAAYEALSGVPVLCNTSANFNGRGFFPGAADAMNWGRTRYVWSAGILYTKV
jgi:carbamoyltransferase